MNLRWVWPQISDKASARDAIIGGFWSCVFIAAVNTAIAIYTLATHQKVAGYYDAWVLVDGGLFAVVAWRLRRNSRAWALIGLILMAMEAVDKLQNARSTFGVITVVLLLAILNATRGAFAFHKYSAREVVNGEAPPALYCIQCGTANPDAGKFCISCGLPLYRGNADAKAPQTNNLKRIIWASVVVLAIVALVTIGAFLVGRPDNSTDKPSVLSSPSKQPGPDISNALPSVLTIVVVGKHDTNVVQGSGFILNATGLAGTNYHVLKGAVKAYAESADGHQFEIRSIEGIDKNRDLVVFQLVDRLTGETPTNLSSVSVRSSNGLTIGERVVAIGSPEGLQNTVSDGILSAIREIDGTRFLQITAPISPGSSGGPVLDAHGQMVGVATFQLEEGQNLNFALSVDHIGPVADQHLGIPLSSWNRAASNSGGQLLSGIFNGTVFNDSVNLSAKFGIWIHQSKSMIEGCMAVEEPLFGSGPLTGSGDESTVSFAVTSDDVGRIIFEGHRSGQSISGTYNVERQDGGHENGRFMLKKGGSERWKGTFDPNMCPADAEFHSYRTSQREH